MSTENHNFQQTNEKNQRSYSLSMFFLHLAAYVFLGCIILYDTTIARGVYRDAILVVNAAVFIIWTGFLINHARKVYLSQRPKHENDTE